MELEEWVGGKKKKQESRQGFSVMKWFFGIIGIALLLTLTVTSLTIYFNGVEARALPDSLNLLTVEIYPEECKLYPGETQVFEAVVEGGVLPFRYRWDANHSYVGDTCTVEFGFEEQCDYVILTVTVWDSEFGYGYDSVFVYDPSFASRDRYFEIPASPYSAVVETNGTHYAWYNGTSGKREAESTNSTYVTQSALDKTPRGGIVFFGVGNFGDATGGYLNIHVTQQGQRLIGSGRGNDNAPYGGTVLYVASNGGIDFSNSGDERWFPYISDMTISGGNHTSAKGVHSDNQKADEKLCGLIVERIQFVGFGGSGSHCIDLTNLELGVIRDCWLRKAPNDGSLLRLTSNNYMAGNCRIYNNYFNPEGSTGVDAIRIDNTDGNEDNNYEIYDNHLLSSTSPTYFLHLNAGSMIKQVKLFGNRMEYGVFLRCSGSGDIKYVNIYDNPQLHGQDGDPAIEMTNQAWEWNIHNNFFRHSGVCISDASNEATHPNLIHDNIFDISVGGGTFYSPSGTNPTSLADNVGYNPYGNCTSCVSGSYLIDSNSGGQIADNTQYTNRHSPKTVFMQDAGTFDVYFNGQLVFDDVNQASVYLGYGDTFKVDHDGAMDSLFVYGH